MRILPCSKMTGIPDAVKVDGNLYYWDGRKPHAGAWPADRTFAKTVLRTLSDWGDGYGFTVLHLGIYNYRPVRTASGASGTRLSNHAYGRAIDWCGVIDSSGKRHTPYQLADNAAAKFNELHRAIKAMVKDAGFRLEWLTYRDKGTWLHVGLVK